jgi:type I restriction enzyme R subunit
VIRASLGNRAKESLLVDFINQTDLDQIGDKASVIDAFSSLLKRSSSVKRRS